MPVAGLAMLMAPIASAAEPVDNPDAGRPAVWQGKTGVVGVQVAFDPEPFLPVTDIVNVALPEGTTEWDPTRASARASTVYPGGFVTGFPNLILPMVIGSEAPPYPAAAQAKHPDRPDDSVAGLGTAHAGRDHVESRATFQHPDAPAQQAGVMDIGSVTTFTRQDWDEDVLVTRAQTLITDITIVEQIRIDSVKVVAVARSKAGEAGETSTEVSVSGVTVAGVPAVIDQNGISIAGQNDGDAILGGAGSAAKQAVAFLEEMGQDVDIRLVGASEDVEGSEARAEAAGLLVSLTFEIGSPTGEPLPGDAQVLTLANLVFDLLPDDAAKPIPPGPNTVFRKYFTNVAIGKATATAFTDTADFGSGIGDIGGLGDIGDLTEANQGSVSDSASVSAPAQGGSGARATPPGEAPGTNAPTAGETAAPEPLAASDGPGQGSIGDPLLLAALPAERLETVLAFALITLALLFGSSRLLARRMTEAS